MALNRIVTDLSEMSGELAQERVDGLPADLAAKADDDAVIKRTGAQSKAGVLTLTDKHVINLVGNAEAATCQIIPALSVPGPSDVIWGEGMSSTDVGASGKHSVFSCGFNCSGVGGPIDPTKVMVRDAQEYRYPQGDTHQSERHVAEITYPAGLGGVAMATSRPITINSYHETRNTSIAFASSAWGWHSEFLDYAIGSFNWDPDTLTTSISYSANNVSGFSFTLGSSGDTLSFGRAASADVQMGITGQTVQFDLANNTSTATLRLLNGSNDLEILAGGNLGISIDGPTSAVSLPGSLAVTGSITGTIAQSQVTGLSASLGAKADLTANQTLSGLNKFTSPIWAKLTTGGGPNAIEVRGTGDILLGWFDSLANLTCANSNARVTLGVNQVVFLHDGSNGAIQNNVGSVSLMNVSASGSVAIGTNGSNRLVIDSAGASNLSGSLAIGNGTAIKKHLAVAAPIDFGSVAAQDSLETTVTVTGAVVGMARVSITPRSSPTSGLIFTGRISAADTVTVRANNFSAAPIDPASSTYDIVVETY